MRYCGRQFKPLEIGTIRALIAAEPNISRYRISTKVCESLDWRQHNGRLKDMSCRVALLRMEADGLISLPPPRWAKPVTYREHPEIESAVVQPSVVPEVDLGRLSVDLVATKPDSLLWNAYIQRHHYLGHQLMPGAQLRYFIRFGCHVIALFGFGASAWKINPRDQYIGWTIEQRKRNLHLVVNNARFLILPWINRHNLASRVLGMISRRLPDDWQSRYSYRPALLETFVEENRFLGTSYKAANWRYLGKTQGRGKLDKHHKNAEPIKTIWAYPLDPNFRRILCT